MVLYRARVRRGGNVEHLAVVASEGDLLAVGDLPRGRQVSLGDDEVAGHWDGHVGEAQLSAFCRCNEWAEGLFDSMMKQFNFAQIPKWFIRFND